MHTLAHDLRYAVRMLQRNPGVTAVAVLALALGIGANTAVFTVLNGVLLRPLPFPEAERLLVVSNAPMRGPFGPTLGIDESQYLELRRANRSYDGVAMFHANQVSLTGAGEAARLASATVTVDFFRVLRLAPEMGRGFQDGESAPVVLLGDDIWRTRFHADRNILGQAIKLDGVAHTVIGVMPAGFHFPYEAQLWTPLEVRVDPHLALYRPVVARLKPGQTREQAQAEWQTITSRMEAGTPPGRNPPVARVLPIKDLLVGDARQSLRIFAGAVAFVLLIACANVANLLLMRAEARRHEIAVRVALGAGWRRLVRQMLTESLVVSALGGAVGILLALWGVPALLAMAPKGRIPRMADIHVDATVLGFTLGVSILTGLLFGAAPAFQAARRAVRDSLSRGVQMPAGAGGGLRNALAVGEIALALVLLTGAGLMLKSLWRLHAVDNGYHPGNVLTMTVNLPQAVYRRPPDIKAFHSRMLDKLNGMPAISAAAAVNWIPLGGILAKGDFHVQGGTFPRDYLVDKLVVSPNYFRAMGIRVVSGRDFSDRDSADAPGAAVISQSVARTLWPGEDPLGKQISERDQPKAADWYTIVGVVDDVRQSGPAQRPASTLYFPYTQTPVAGWLPYMTYVVRSAGGGFQAAPAMRAALHEVDADLPVERMASMQDLMATSAGERTLQARLLAAFAVLALLLAVVGIYGVLAYAVAMRTREIGIRMALGAESGTVLYMVLRRTMAIAAAGLVLGTGGALFATRVLEKTLFEVKPNDPATMIAVACILGAAAMAAGWIPARRAARVDPLVALRWE